MFHKHKYCTLCIYVTKLRQLQTACNKFFTSFEMLQKLFMFLTLFLMIFVLKHLKMISCWSKNVVFTRMMKGCFWQKLYLFTW